MDSKEELFMKRSEILQLASAAGYERAAIASLYKLPDC
jgi:hypothetical protein